MAVRMGKIVASVLVTALSGTSLAGCAGAGDFGENVSVPQEKRVPLHSEFAEGKAYHFPKDRPFNVIDAQRSSTGSATAESEAREGGTAFCRAGAESVGTARAEFQLGQILAAEYDKPVDVTVVFDLDYEYSVNTDAADTTKPEDTLALKAYIADSNRVTLKKALLVNLDATAAPEQFSGRDNSSFSVTLHPGLAYHLVLAGMVEVTGTEKSAASAAIEIRSLRIELLPRNTKK